MEQGPAAWTQPLEALLARLHGSPSGLSTAEAESRLARFGHNVLGHERRRAPWVEFLARFRNPLVLVLLFSSVVLAVVHDVTSSTIIAVIVLMSVTLDFVQEHRAGQAAERLRSSVALRARVLRQGGAREVPASELVPGDVVLLAAGNVVPADARLLEAKDLHVNQAMLTGEPYPVEKRPVELPPSTRLSEADNTVFAGTAVIGGAARVLVFATGVHTQMGDIAHALSVTPPSTAFERETRQFGLMVMRLTMLLVLFVLATHLFANRPPLESFLFAVALAVGLTPELLPMVVSVTLARGALRMARQQVIVKRLSAVHDLGGMDVLCTDKTGTLTEATIRLVRHEDTSGHESGRVLELALLTSRFAAGVPNPMDAAILAREAEVDVRGWHKVDEVPFDFERRRVSVLMVKEGRCVLVVKGAPEDVLRRSTRSEEAGRVLALTPEVRARLQARYAALGEDGLRVLAVAWRDAPAEARVARPEDEEDLVFAGYVAFLDPPKQGARATLVALANLGVATKVVSGDDARVALHVCRQLDVETEGVLTGQEVAGLDEAALEVRVEQATVFARMSPTEKSRVIQALRRRGHVVGFLGDGINDAPSLKAADVGISVDGAVDVAREAADLILLRHDLDVLRDGVLEGRRTFGNVMKYIRMGTSSNFGNMLSMAGASVVLPFIPMRPLQILLNNLLYDVSELAIPLDSVDAEQVQRPTRWDLRGVRLFMAIFGALSSLFDVATFTVLLSLFPGDVALFRTGWFMESLTTQVLVIFIIRTRRNPLRSRPSPWLVLTSLGAVGVGCALPYVGMGRWFGFVPPPASVVFALASLVVVYLLFALWLNRAFSRRFTGAARPRARTPAAPGARRRR
ncbi:magnesium-translocating P-type ATPase [Myxococcus stipitatus]|uniref:magnesium-translocating P-type ATPase n=1 Tax=Myxococcus stipitatus TaxID=83455 RepID=UPI001F3BF38A|nr:magnesium-translocating P-type ATPase [Myxococcus stipitatus]MCE9670841.1 magnesium-translocating P-type ATPase [Myxococcus stipitatus]